MAAAFERLVRLPNWTHIHLMINHLPVIGLAVPITLLLVDWARKNRKLEWLSLQMFVVFALLGIPVYLTGSPASHQLREMPGISRDAIHRHSNAADFAFWTMEGLGAISLGALYKFRSTETVPQRLTAALLALAVVALGLMLWTADLGGKTRHSKEETSIAVVVGARHAVPDLDQRVALGVPALPESAFCCWSKIAWNIASSMSISTL
jgi:hypothetical protein